MDIFKSKRQKNNEDLAAVGVYFLGYGVLLAGFAGVCAWLSSDSDQVVIRTTTTAIDWESRRDAQSARAELRTERLARYRAEGEASSAKADAEHQKRCRQLKI